MKKWSAILACLLLAAGIWLMMNLSRVHTDLETVSVVAICSIEGHSNHSVAVDITARCKASGFDLISLKLSNAIVEVRFSPDDFTQLQDDIFVVEKDRLIKYIPDIFGPGVSVEAFAAQNFKFKFEKESYRKVPVRGVQFIDYRTQYTALSPISFSPDSIAVYAEPDKLKEIDCIQTKPISLKDVKSSRHGIVQLMAPQGARLSVNEVAYELQVCRYVDITETAIINVLNLPAGKDLSIMPDKAEVTYRCAFPVIHDPRGNTKVFVDYSDFEKSISGTCMIKAETDDNVIEVKIKPETCLCVENGNL